MKKFIAIWFFITFSLFAVENLILAISFFVVPFIFIYFFCEMIFEFIKAFGKQKAIKKKEESFFSFDKLISFDLKDVFGNKSNKAEVKTEVVTPKREVLPFSSMTKGFSSLASASKEKYIFLKFLLIVFSLSLLVPQIALILLYCVPFVCVYFIGESFFEMLIFMFPEKRIVTKMKF